MNRRVSITPSEQDDTVNIAGWVFADLLLVLAVIFLTSISFAVPSKSGDAPQSSKNSGQAPDISEVKNSPLAQGFNFYYTKFDKDKIESDLKTYFDRENLSLRTSVIYAQIAGGFDPATEGSDLGTMRALEFSIALKRANVTAFEGANFDLTTTSAIKPGRIALRLSFAPPIG